MCAVDEKHQVVVITADGAVSEFVNRHLDGSGIEVRHLSCGKILLESEDDLSDADLIIVDAGSDVADNRLDGIALARELKTCLRTVSIPIMMASASTPQRHQGFEIGVDDCFSCNDSGEEFALRLRGLLRVSTARRVANSLRLNAEVKRREEIGNTFRRYVSPALVDQILSDARLRDLALANKSTRVNATVLFADMRGFTSISEKLMAAEVVPLLNQYFRLLTDIAFEYEGTVFNMAGDCLMVGFGVPFEQPDATVRAYHTAMKMLASFDELVGEWRGRYGIKAGLGIGVNSGEVIAGNVGSPHFMSYTIIGDAVNVAARLSQRARAGELLFSQKVKAALDAAGENCSAVPLEPSSLRGRSETIDIFWVTGPRQAKTPAD